MEIQWDHCHVDLLPAQEARSTSREDEDGKKLKSEMTSGEETGFDAA